MESTNVNIPIQQLRTLLSSGESSETLVLRITELFPALICVYDPLGKKISFINRRITELLGYEWDEVEKWNNALEELVHPGDIQGVYAEIEKISSLEEGNSYSFDCRLNHRWEGFRYFRTIGTVLRRNHSGAPASLLLMAQDITSQVTIEKEKKAAREVIENTERMLKVGMWSFDKELGRTEWSDGMYELMGYNRNEVPVIPAGFFYEHVCPADKEELFQKGRESQTTGKEYRLDFSINRKDGSRLFITSVVKPVLNTAGELIKLTGINRDISDQYMQNLEYRANKELQKQTEHMLNYGVFIWHLQQDSTSWSDGLYEIFEMTKEGHDKPVSWNWYLQQVADEDREKLEQTVKAALEEGSEFEVEYAIHTANGNQKIVNMKGSVVRDNNKVPIRVVGNTRDITRVKQVENELQRNVRELHRSNRELEEFAYAASHDLQEPLRKINTFGSRLEKKYSEVLGEEGRMYINRMQVASNNMRSLIDNLLELSRVTSSRQPFELIHLAKPVKEAISDLELTIEETGAVIQIGPMPEIEGIPSQLRQMFYNLLSNALKFRKKDVPPVIHIKATKLIRREKEAHFLSPDNNYFRVDISDNGIGFDQDYEQRIFQIFQRLHGKAEYPGSGIGLAICKKIAERHNGNISAKGREGEGAVFSIIFPDKQ